MTSRQAIWCAGVAAMMLATSAGPAFARPDQSDSDVADIALGALGPESAEPAEDVETAPDAPAVEATPTTTEPAPTPAPNPAAARDDGPRRVVVADFESPRKEWARPSVLAVLSAQADVEIVGYQDAVVVAHRLGADTTSSAGRRTLSGEMRIFAWIDGTIGDDLAARLWMTDANGEKIAWLEVKAANGDALNRYVESNLWLAFGPYLSDAERDRQTLEGHKVLAQKKKEARDAELARQREIAAQRAEQASARLEAFKKLGTDRARAREGELARQRKLVADRRAEEERKQREAQAELQRKLAEQRRQQWAAAQPQPVPSYTQPAPSYAQPAPSYAQSTPPSYAQPAPSYAQPAPAAVYAQPVVQPSSAQPYGSYGSPSAPPADGMTPEFRAWAEQRKAAIAAERAQNPAP